MWKERVVQHLVGKIKKKAVFLLRFWLAARLARRMRRWWWWRWQWFLVFGNRLQTDAICCERQLKTSKRSLVLDNDKTHGQNDPLETWQHNGLVTRWEDFVHDCRPLLVDADVGQDVDKTFRWDHCFFFSLPASKLKCLVCIDVWMRTGPAKERDTLVYTHSRAR